ncbi:TonB-dependent receptor [Steroidobacter cummioxidans]|uniref:TonB-dependent receptor n=1 Tax=Steroidobacter cummioxidans TaxID=1803913 RepID=UPI00137AF6FB|nr:TonB-dependent receptor [Steroidobacter cummioxidans]
MPLSSDVFLRTSASGTKRDGYTRNTLTGGEIDDHETATGRLQLRYTPTDSLDLQLSVDGYRVRDGQPGLRRVGPGPTLVEGSSNPFTGAYDLQGRADSDGVGIAGHVRYTTDNFTFVSISAYREIDEELITDLDGGPTRLVVQSSSFHQQQLSQEFQLLGETADERLKWIVGLYGFRERARYTEVTDVFDGTLVLDFGTAPKNASYAAFGQFDYQLTPRLTATAGLRYTYDEREMTLVNGTFVPPAIDNSWSKLTPRLSLAFQATDSLLAYATASQGFKSGQFNARASRLPEFRALEPETVWAYELGVKSRWLEDRLQLNGSAFFSDYKDIQLQTFVAQPNNIDFISSNAPRGEVRGVELELIAQPLRNLTLQATLGLVDAEFTEYHDVSGNDLAGRKFAQTPETTYSLAAQYSHDVGEGTLRFASGYDYRSKHFLDVTNHADLAQGGFGLLSGRVTYATAFDRMEVSLYGKNLTDERYITAGYNLRALVGSGVAAFGAPRTYGVEVQFRFD